MHQKSVNVGILTNWTKSFNCPGVVGEDVVRLLEEAIERNTDLDITVNSVLNDTTGWFSLKNFSIPQSIFDIRQTLNTKP